MLNLTQLAGFGGGNQVWSRTITSNQQEMNLATWATSEGWDGVAPVEITIADGVYVWSDSTSTAALTTGVLPLGSRLIVLGAVMGKGGNGQSAIDSAGNSTPATSGGPAISLSCDISIASSVGYILGGGGGGKGGNDLAGNWLNTGGGGGGAGGGVGGNIACYDDWIHYSGGAGGAPGQKGSDGTNGCGGGGGRKIPGTGGAGGTTTADSGIEFSTSGAGGDCGGGGGAIKKNPTEASATGGAGGSTGAGGDGTNTANIFFLNAAGGGGGWGAAGGASMNGSGRGSQVNASGTVGGNAVVQNGYTPTWIGGFPASRVYGAVS